MKPLSVTLLAIAFLITGFAAGLFFSYVKSEQKLTVQKEQLNYLNELHDFQKKNSKEAYIASVSILRKIDPLISDGTILSKGKPSKDPIKNLLLQSYECISGNAQVIDNYRHVYAEDSVFLKKYFKLEE